MAQADRPYLHLLPGIGFVFSSLAGQQSTAELTFDEASSTEVLTVRFVSAPELAIDVQTIKVEMDPARGRVPLRIWSEGNMRGTRFDGETRNEYVDVPGLGPFPSKSVSIDLSSASLSSPERPSSQGQRP